MSKCKRSTCTNPVGQQDRDDYRDSRFCSIQCDVKHEHIKADARDAKASMEAEADDPEGYF
jgi:hypothetical protein